MRRCISCGRIIKDDTVDTAGNGKNEELKYCSECLDENGKLKTYDEVSESLAKYLIRTQGLDEKAALNAAKAIASSQPEWDKKQGIYFEKDMRKKKRLVVVLFTILALLLAGTGIGLWVYFNGKTEADVLPKDDDYDFETTRMVEGIEVHELELPYGQFSPKQMFGDNPNIISFATARYTKSGDWMGGVVLHGYNIENGYGRKLSFPITRFTKQLSGSMYGNIVTEETFPSNTEIKNNMWIVTTKAKGKDNSTDESNGIKAVATSICEDAFYPKSNDGNSPKTIGFYNYFTNFQNRENEWISIWMFNRDKPIQDPKFLDGYILWTERDSDANMYIQTIDRIILYNTSTEREFVVSDSVYRASHEASDDFIVWLDNRDITHDSTTLYGFDIKKGEEFKICDAKNVVSYEVIGEYILVSKKIQAEKRLEVFDTNSKEMLTEILSENYIQKREFYTNGSDFFNSSIEPIESNAGDTPEKTYVSWIEITKENEKGMILDSYIAVQNIADIGQTPMKAIRNNGHGDSPNPILVTSEYIIWGDRQEDTEGDTLWIGQIDDGFEDGVIICKKIDYSDDLDFAMLGGIYDDVEIIGENVFWTKVGENGNNICWAKISDIFPDKTDVAGTEE